MKSDDEKKKRSGAQRLTHSGAFVANETTGMSKSTDRWIVDSSASRHMTPYRNLITDYKEFTTPGEIVLGDGKLTEARGEGSIYFTSGMFSGELKEVLRVPGLTKNLFSVSRAMAQNCEVRFANEPEEVHFLKDGQVKLIGHRGLLSLFILNLQVRIRKANTVAGALLGAPLKEWHRRFAHANENSIRQLISKEAVTGLKIQALSYPNCKECVAGKICRAHHPTKSDIVASANTAVLCIDTVGPMSTPSIGGARYFVLATEEYSNFRSIEFVRQKSSVPAAVKQIVTKIELASKKPIKKILTDNRSEYVNRELDSWLSERGIVHETSATYTPEQNGRAERANRTVVEGIRTLLSSINFLEGEVKDKLWAKAAHNFVYCSNFLLAPSSDKTRHELLFGTKPDVSHLRWFGQKVMARLQANERSSRYLAKAVECFFLGYTERRNTYRLHDDSFVAARTTQTRTSH